MSKQEEILHKLTTEERNYIKNKMREKDNLIAKLEKALKEKDRLIQDIIESLPDVQKAEWCSIGSYVPNSKGGFGYFSGCIEDCSKCAENYFKTKAKEMLRNE